MSVTVEKDGPVTIVRLSRPEVRNAVNHETAEKLANAFRDFDADDDALVGVFHGDNGTFCAGADLKGVATGQGNRTAPDGDGPMGPSRMFLSKPVIGSIAGYAVAGGLELSLWCDMRVAEEGATFGVFCRRWGVPLIDGGTVRLPRLIGLSNALDLILTGRPVSAEEGLRMGLVNRVVPKGETLDAAKAIAHQIAKFPQVCMRNDRRSAYEQFDLSFADAMANEFQLGLESLQAGAAEGAKRFAQGKGRGGNFDDI